MSPVYRADIDGIRTVAVIAVILFHAFPGYLPGGFAGVDIFFVISGFLISGLILREAEQGEFSIANFYARRITRIFPALILILAISLLFGWYVLFPDEYRQLAKHTVAGAGFVSNLVLLREAGYFDSTAQSKPLLHLWSLGIEEQFYIFWPLFLVLVRKYTKWIMPAVTAVAIVSFALNVFAVSRHPSDTFYLPVTRVWELMIGAALAVAGMRERAVRSGVRVTNEAMAVAGSMLIAVTLLLLDEKRPFPGWWALLPTLGTAFLIQAGPGAWVNRTMLSSRPAVFIGLMSYPLYLWHWPVLVYLKLITDSDYSPLSPTESGIAKSVALMTVFALAWATWKFVETPIRSAKGMNAALRTRALIAAMGAVAFFGAISLARLMTARLDNPAIARILKAADDWDYPGTNFRNSSFTVEEIPSRSREITLFAGDSHMEQYWPRAKAAIGTNSSLASAVFATSGGCPPLPGLNRAGFYCSEFYDYWVRQASVTNVRTIVIGGFWERYVAGSQAALRLPPGVMPYEMFNALGSPLTPADIEGAWNGLERTVASLIGAGKRVVLLSSSPTSPAFDPHAMIQRFRNPRIVGDQSIDKDELNRLLAPIDARLSHIAASTGAVLVHPVDYFCGERNCPATDDDGSPMYRDWSHLRAATAARKATFIDLALYVF